jgi:hypothetical protein
MGHVRPEITQQHIEQIRQLIGDHPDWNRTRLSEELCELWGWKSDVGQRKDISCRDLLRKLDADGQIRLPPQKKRGTLKGRSGSASIQLSLFHTAQPTLIETKLKAVMPVAVEIADARERIGEFRSLIDQYHYLGYGQSVGECMRYMVKSRDGSPLACLMFGSSAWRCASRDNYIDWTDEGRRAKLYLTTNNTRFLILPWVRIPYLASHILSLIARRISQDWQTKYGHPLYLLETFVERDRFAGTCYKAANWVRVGETTGRGRDSLSNQATLPIKDVYVYPLSAHFRKKLTGTAPPVLREGDGNA